MVAVGLALLTGFSNQGDAQTQKVEVQKTKSTGCPYARAGLSFYRARYVHWTIARGDSVPTWRHPRNCADARFLANVWAQRSARSREATRLWLESRTLHDFTVTDGNHAWHRAVRETQRAYPGTEAWLLSCSSGEGGHGRWVPNSQGSGVGGWMQMYPSTFSTMMHGYYLPSAGRWFEGAWKDLQGREFRVPRSALSWYSPLGQALASAYGMLNGRKGEWDSYRCR